MDMELTARLDRIALMVVALVEGHAVGGWYTTPEFAPLADKAGFTVREWYRLGRIRAKEAQPGVQEPKTLMDRRQAGGFFLNAATPRPVQDGRSGPIRDTTRNFVEMIVQQGQQGGQQNPHTANSWTTGRRRIRLGTRRTGDASSRRPVSVNGLGSERRRHNAMLWSRQPTDPDTRGTTVRLARKCRQIQACLREEERIDADRNFRGDPQGAGGVP
jgi:hypothetical protein